MMEQERRLIEAAQKDPCRFAELYETNFERVYAFGKDNFHEHMENLNFAHTALRPKSPKSSLYKTST